MNIIVINDLLIEQEVLKLQLQLQDEMMMQFKLLFLEMMSTPTNKLATYFGDDKPTSRSKVKCKLSEIAL